MTTLQMFGVIAGIAAAFVAVFGAFVGALLRGFRTWSKIDRTLVVMERTINDHIVTSDRTHSAINEALAADRHATNERLQYLERNVWNRGGATGGRAT